MEPRLYEQKAELAALCSLPGVANRHVLVMLATYGSPAEAWKAVRAGRCCDTAGAGTVERWRLAACAVDPERYLEDCAGAGISVTARGEPSYPPPLAETHDPPWVLFHRGAMTPLTGAVAVVGSRKATPYGMEVAGALAGGLSEAGVTVVSGAAYGVDSAAHRGALEAGGVTLAVLGCGPDVAYPRSSAGLLDAISTSGSVISEYPPGTRPLKYYFPARNRIIAGMCSGVVVVEASESSGALITAEVALSEGREVMAVPGRVNSRNSAGTNELIRSGASLVTCAEDVLEELGMTARPRDASGEAHAAADGFERALLSMIEDGVTDVDGIAARSGTPAGEVLSVLSRMEVSGLVRRGPGGFYSRSTRK